MEYLLLEHFAPCINQTFYATLDGLQIPFVLVEAAPVPVKARNHHAVRDAFSLLFRNESAFLYPQQTYPMRHPRLGEVGIFLVPVARDRDGFLYQAIFN